MLTEIIILTIVLELITVFCRFGLGRQVSKDLAWLGRFSGGYRVHHGYWAIVLLPLGYSALVPFAELLLIVGWALVLSDLIHHFLVLWPVTGHHEFHFKFPEHQ